MKLTWFGHACFALEHDGYRIVTDPYTGVDGYPELHTTAHEVYCSHQHADHNAVQCVTILPPRKNPFTVREIPSFHDDKNGTLRGKNTIRIFTAGNVSVAHMGDLGHSLTPQMKDALAHVNAVLIPVGGYYTIGAEQAKQICDTLKVPCVVPMHYFHPPYGLPVVGKVDDFLKLWPEHQIHRLNTSSFELTPETSGVIVPAFTE